MSRLSDELSMLQAEEAKLIANGSYVPIELQNRIRAKSNSLDFQMQRMRDTKAHASNIGRLLQQHSLVEPATPATPEGE